MCCLTLLHSERPKLHTILAFLGIGLNKYSLPTCTRKQSIKLYGVEWYGMTSIHYPDISSNTDELKKISSKNYYSTIPSKNVFNFVLFSMLF